jgi:hypothetical protein
MDFEDYSKGANLVLLNPEIAKVFPIGEAVNDALQSIIRSVRLKIFPSLIEEL